MSACCPPPYRLKSLVPSSSVREREPHRAVGATAVAVDYGEAGKPNAVGLPVDLLARRRRRPRVAVAEPAERPPAARRVARQLPPAPIRPIPLPRVDHLPPPPPLRRRLPRAGSAPAP